MVVIGAIAVAAALAGVPASGSDQRTSSASRCRGEPTLCTFVRSYLHALRTRDVAAIGSITSGERDMCARQKAADLPEFVTDFCALEAAGAPANGILFGSIYAEGAAYMTIGQMRGRLARVVRKVSPRARDVYGPGEWALFGICHPTQAQRLAGEDAVVLASAIRAATRFGPPARIHLAAYVSRRAIGAARRPGGLSIVRLLTDEHLDGTVERRWSFCRRPARWLGG